MALPIIAALAAPIIGGAMTLAGGAMSLTGGVLTAGSTVAGIAADAAGSVIGAVGGLLGGGKSGNVEEANEVAAPKTPKGTYISKDGRLRNDGTKGQKGSFASMSGGMSLAKVKSSIDPVGAEGGVSMLPTGKESQVSLLSQILGQIRTNTGALFSIDAKIGGLANAALAPPPTPSGKLLGDAKKTKGGGVMSSLGKSVTGTFSALGKRLKGLSGSLAGAAKFALKGLLLTGALVLFRKYRENIVGFISRTFEKLSDFVKTFDTKDPIGSFFDKLMSTGEGSILSSLKNGVMFIIDEIINALKLFVNDLNIPFLNFEIGKVGYDGSARDSLTNQAESVGGAENLGTVRGTASILNSKLGFKDMGGTEVEQVETTTLVKSHLEMMYANVVGSKGRVQWTNIGAGFTIGGGINSLLNSNIPIADIMSSQPIIDGKVRNIEDLNNIEKFMPSAENLGITNEVLQKQFRENAASLTEAKQMFDANSKLQANNPDMLKRTTDFYGENVTTLKARQLALVPTVSASNDGSGSFNVLNANDQKQTSITTGATINQLASVGTRETTAQAAFITSLQ
jgi:hypothetical protein